MAELWNGVGLVSSVPSHSDEKLSNNHVELEDGCMLMRR